MTKEWLIQEDTSVLSFQQSLRDKIFLSSIVNL